MESIDYTINDEIVKIETTPLSKEGEVFIAKALVYGCPHYPILVDIGKTLDKEFYCKCDKCFKLFSKTILYGNAKLYKKLDTLVNIDELTDVLKGEVFK